MLLGCDYLDPIPKIGPATAYTLIKTHGTIAAVVEKIRSGELKYTMPADYPHEDARELFLHPDTRNADAPECDFKWEKPDVEGLVKFLVEEKGFSEDRVRAGATRLSKSSGTQQQSRLEGFFKVQEKTDEEKQNLKRKNEARVDEKKKKQKLAAKEKKVAKAKPRGAA